MLSPLSDFLCGTFCQTLGGEGILSSGWGRGKHKYSSLKVSRYLEKTKNNEERINPGFIQLLRYIKLLNPLLTLRQVKFKHNLTFTRGLLDMLESARLVNPFLRRKVKFANLIKDF